MTNHQILKELYNQGYRTKVMHNRMLSYGKNGCKMCAKGGSTQVAIRKNNRVVAIGLAECSKKDNYCKRLGLTIALGRALKALKESKEDGIPA